MDRLKMHSREMLLALGVQGGRLPLAGLPPRVINGVTVWVNPAQPRNLKEARKSSTHRVMCECPDCHATLSAGRLFQHVCNSTRAATRESADLDRADAGLKQAVAALNAAHTSGIPTAEPVPCPFCDKPFPGVYGEPGVAMLRADNRTVICAECGTREALEGGLKMPVSRFLEFFTDSHNVYGSDDMAARLLALTGVKAPWTPRSAQSIRREMRADPRGGTLDPSVADSLKMVAGFVMAEALAWELARYHSTRTGRGFRFRECIDALRGNGH